MFWSNKKQIYSFKNTNNSNNISKIFQSLNQENNKFELIIIAHLKNHTSWVNNVSFSPTGEIFATGSRDLTAVMYGFNPKNLESYLKVLFVLKDHSQSILSACFSPSGGIFMLLEVEIRRLFFMARIRLRKILLVKKF